MRGEKYYYTNTDRIIRAEKPDLYNNFLDVVRKKNSRELYFWLSENDKKHNFSEEMKKLISDFYWEIF